jgi:hypothetical protein
VNKTIFLTVHPSGQTQIETKGFAGRDCLEATHFLESALGKQTSARLTPEFYQLAQQQTSSIRNQS